MENKYDIIVVGAGASGLIAAGRAAELGAKVLLLEKMRQEGRKLAITGKGRCNITNDAAVEEFINHIHPNGKFLRNAFSRFFSDDIIRLIEENGVDVQLERGGRYFPASNKAPDIVKALVRWVKKQGVQIRCGWRVDKIFIDDGKITGIRADAEVFQTSKVILAMGGKSYPATGSKGEGYEIARHAGHSIVKPRPSLVPLETLEDIPKETSGLILKNARATLWINSKKKEEQFGEATFMEFGLSGPIILTMSRRVVEELNNRCKIEINLDLKPALSEQKLDNRLLRDLDEYGNLDLKEVIRKWLPRDLISYFIKVCGIDVEKKCHQVSSKERKKIRHLLKNLKFNITGHRSFKEAIITSGGISLKEIDSKTMESKIVKGLYFAGEIIDLDAETGGYNLQIAWSTGYVAGEAAASE